MKDKIKLAAQTVWLMAGCLVVFFILSVGLDVAATMKDVKEVWSELSAQDIRQALNIAEKEIDADLFEAMTYRGYISDSLVEWTPENWNAFLDFCNRTGYIVTDENWQRYVHGQLTE